MNGHTLQRFDHKGLTLIELMTAMVLVGVLVGIIWMKWNASHEKALRASMISDMRNLALAQELYSREYGTYASTAAQISEHLDPSPTSTIHITTGTPLGWAGWNEIAGIDLRCEYYVGDGVTPALGVATTSERIACAVP